MFGQGRIRPQAPLATSRDPSSTASYLSLNSSGRPSAIFKVNVADYTTDYESLFAQVLAVIATSRVAKNQ